MELDINEFGLTKQEERNLYRRVTRTLRRIPVDIRLDLATREFDMGSRRMCLIGTAVRAGLAKAVGGTVEDAVEPWDVTEVAAEMFGGKESSWNEIFQGVVKEDTFPIIERAFVNVLLETV